MEKFRWSNPAPGTDHSGVLFAQSEEASDIDSFEETSPKDQRDGSLERLGELRCWFDDAVEARKVWDKDAYEDYRFYAGDQWPLDKGPLGDGGRPSLTLNKIKSVVNAVLGYQTQNRYEPSFMPRTDRDNKLADVRKAVTKYILDQCDYSDTETKIFQDMLIGGIGWLYCGWIYDDKYPMGKMDIRRVSPFDVYVDPEARELNFSDAEYVLYATWQSKGKVARMFPEWASDIYAMNDDELPEEDPETNPKTMSNWFLYDKKKIRLCTCWYKTYETVEYMRDATGNLTPVPDGVELPAGIESQTESRQVVRCATFIRDILLEDMPSPYQHNMIPLVPLVGYFTNEGDVPAGIVRDIKDPQMEINKRRSQILHIIGTQSFSGMLVEQGAMTKEQQEHWRRFGSKPGMITEVTPGAITTGKIQEIVPKPLPDSVARLEDAFQADIKSITGINEEMLGMDGPKSSSGRAIELRQRMAITQIALLFDNLRDMKLRFMYLLWGQGSLPGMVQQYYKEEMVIRITEDAESPQFRTVNKSMPVGVDNSGNVLFTTLNDLSVGEFDIVITESPATPTKRYSDFLAFMELMKTPLGAVVSQIAPDLFLEFSDLPNKEKVAQRLRDAMQQQQQAAQAQQQAKMGQGSQSNPQTPAQAQAQADGIDANV